MARLWNRLRLPLAVLLAVFLGYLILRTPGTLTVTMADGVSTATVPRGLEGWHLTPGQDSVLLKGGTRLGLISLQVETTNVPKDGNLQAYIADRQHDAWLAQENYQPRLKGELRTWGEDRAPVARAVYDGKFLGFQTRMVQHDVYWPYQWQYVRIGLTFPEFLDDYMGPDQYFLATHLTFAK
jgi:hypothetical protein